MWVLGIFFLSKQKSRGATAYVVAFNGKWQSRHVGEPSHGFPVALKKRIQQYAIAADSLLPVSQERFPTRTSGHSQLNTHTAPWPTVLLKLTKSETISGKLILWASLPHFIHINSTERLEGKKIKKNPQLAPVDDVKYPFPTHLMTQYCQENQFECNLSVALYLFIAMALK